ncbi:MAG: membrane protein insertase YidC [Candidatus Methylacidiphilales bacterium]|nr:membrane protein insertase YidC [Candidatus Methylacidiphilales bacterium]
MDRVSWIGLSACLIALFLWINYSGEKWAEENRARQAAAAIYATNSANLSELERTGATNSPTAGAPYVPGAPGTTSIGPSVSVPGDAVLLSPPNMPAEVKVELVNEEVRATLTSHGASIETVELLKQKDSGRSSNNVVLNKNTRQGILNLFGLTGEYGIVSYNVEKLEKTAATFSYTHSNGLKITRAYELSTTHQEGDVVKPGVITMTQTLTNTTDKPLQVPAANMNVGVVGPLHQHDGDIYTGAAWYQAPDKSYHHTGVYSFLPGSFLGFQYSAARNTISSPAEIPIQWVAVKNQFFTILVAAPKDQPFMQADLHPYNNLPGWVANQPPKGIKAEVWTSPVLLPPGQSVTAPYTVYAGPKENATLSALPNNEVLLMEYGWTGFIVRPLQMLMRLLHGLVGNWGIAIILLTCIIKGAFWPLQSVANKSMKQMQALSPKLKELQEKFKDQPEKQNTEMMKLYRDYGVNPVAGCLPLLIQMPVFIGLYFMLQGATELRGASFLWAHDLTQPDTIYTLHLLGMALDINPFPILMAATQVLLMRMTPSTGDPIQAKMMQFMPLVLLAFLYYFASALALYWTMNNLISAVQTYINLRKPVPTLTRVPKPKKPGAK